MPTQFILHLLFVALLSHRALSAACFGAGADGTIAQNQQSLWTLRDQMCNGHCASWPCTLTNDNGQALTRSGTAHTLANCWAAIGDIVFSCSLKGSRGGVWSSAGESYYLVTGRTFDQELEPVGSGGGTQLLEGAAFAPLTASSITIHPTHNYIRLDNGTYLTDITNVSYGKPANASKFNGSLPSSGICTATTSTEWLRTDGGTYWTPFARDSDYISCPEHCSLSLTNSLTYTATISVGTSLGATDSIVSAQISAGYSWSWGYTTATSYTCIWDAGNMHSIAYSQQMIWYEGYSYQTTRSNCDTGVQFNALSFVRGDYPADYGKYACQ